MYPYILIIAGIVVIFQIVFLIKCFKHKMKWIHCALFEIISIIISIGLIFFYMSLPSDGFMFGVGYEEETLALLIGGFASFVMLTVTVLSVTLLFLIKEKKAGKNHFPTILVILSVILIIRGLISLTLDIQNDLSVGKTTATVIDNTVDSANREQLIVSYEVNGTFYKRTVSALTPNSRHSKNVDEIEVLYNKNNPRQYAAYSDFEKTYIPCFIISIIFLLVAKILRQNVLRKKKALESIGEK